MNAGREPGVIVTRGSDEDIELLIRARPDLYFLTPHYEGWHCVLVRIGEIEEDELASRLEDAWDSVGASGVSRQLPLPRREKPSSGRLSGEAVGAESPE